MLYLLFPPSSQILPAKQNQDLVAYAISQTLLTNKRPNSRDQHNYTPTLFGYPQEKGTQIIKKGGAYEKSATVTVSRPINFPYISTRFLILLMRQSLKRKEQLLTFPSGTYVSTVLFTVTTHTMKVLLFSQCFNDNTVRRVFTFFGHLLMTNACLLMSITWQSHSLLHQVTHS